MITAVDTNILLDVFLPDLEFGPKSRDALAVQFGRGSIVVCDIVYAELAAFFESKHEMDRTLLKLGVRFVALDEDSACEAGNAWRRYSRRRGRKQRVLADFLIGAHAQKQADALLTRDRGFYRDYFPGLNVIAP